MRIAIGLGSSLGPRRRTLERAVMRLDAGAGLDLLGVSRWYRSPPMRGGSARGWFLNGVALFESSMEPMQVLGRCRQLEEAAGRRRALHWADRPLDLDVLAVEGWRSSDPALTVPHPGIAARPFVYQPLREVWPDAIEGLSDLPGHPAGIVAVGVFAPRRSAAYLGLPPRQGQPA